jgi:hypothetical protein
LIPALDNRGLLPPGVHSGTWKDVEATFGTDKRRKGLIGNAKKLSFSTFAVLFPSPLILAGSTFSDKDNPKDIEATIRVDPGNVTKDQLVAAFKIHAMHDFIKQATDVDFYVTMVTPGQNDFSLFFQYVGEKTAVLKNLKPKDKRGVVEVEKWMTP